MMTEEEYMDVLALKRQGKTLKEIGEETGYHPATISGWLRRGGPPPARTIAPAERVVDERWAARIRELIQPPANKLLATSVFEIICAEGFDGSYPSVVRHLRDVRGPRFRGTPAVSVPIETAPGEECQFDWSDCSEWAQRWGLGEVWCLGCVLCWSRWRTWWFSSSIDREHTFEGLVGFFEMAGGVPRVGRTDRMGALGVSQGRRFRLHPPTIGFARHHSIEIRVCQAGDAKRKGKSERPFRDLKEGLRAELDALGPPSSIGELNQRGGLWLAERSWSRPHSTTGERPADRLVVERRFLVALPARRFDTAYVEDRRVHARLPLVEWGGVPYSVTPEVVGSKVVCRLPVDSDVLEVWWGSTLVARHTLDPDATGPVWDPAHRAAAEAIAVRTGPPEPAPGPASARGAATGLGAPGTGRRRLRHRHRRPGGPLRRLRVHRGRGLTMTDAAGPYEQLKADLGYLQLGRAAECFATLAEQATTEEWSHVEYLARVIAEQAAATTNRRLAARLRYARFPYRRTIDEFDFDFQPSVDRKLVADLATLRFIGEGRSIAWLGQPGCGKTHLAVALATLAVEAGYRGYFTSADDMVVALGRARIDGTWAAKLRTYTAPTVLVIDDVGLLPMARDAASSFFHVINQRYEKHVPTLVTTNRSLPGWGEIFGDDVVAGAVLDRILHRAVVFNIRGPSWRMREHQALAEATRRPDDNQPPTGHGGGRRGR